jgi:hypothetical protein
MHIGQPCPELKALMTEHKALSAALITAWNPFSQNLPAKEKPSPPRRAESQPQKARTDLHRRHRQTPQQQLGGRGQRVGSWPGPGSGQVTGQAL